MFTLNGFVATTITRMLEMRKTRSDKVEASELGVPTMMMGSEVRYCVGGGRACSFPSYTDCKFRLPVVEQKIKCRPASPSAYLIRVIVSHLYRRGAARDQVEEDD